jgi:hypothetical protein
MITYSDGDTTTINIFYEQNIGLFYHDLIETIHKMKFSRPDLCEQQKE